MPSSADTYYGILRLVFTSPGDFNLYKKHRRMLVDDQTVTFLDARKAHPDGVRSFKLDVHGFECIEPPPPQDFRDPKSVYKNQGGALGMFIVQGLSCCKAGIIGPAVLIR